VSVCFERCSYGCLFVSAYYPPRHIARARQRLTMFQFYLGMFRRSIWTAARAGEVNRSPQI
jgi:hypothetical protein